MTLKDIRKEKGLLAKKIAELLNISYRQYHRIESGEVNLSNSKITKLSHIFNLSEIEIISAWKEGAV